MGGKVGGMISKLSWALWGLLLAMLLTAAVLALLASDWVGLVFCAVILVLSLALGPQDFSEDRKDT
jgi:hypothetical protein